MRVLRAVALLIAFLACLPLATVAQTASPQPAATPSHGPLIRFAGQLLDAQGGFVFFTTGDAFKLEPGARVVDYATGGPTPLLARTRVYARADFDTATGRIVQLALSPKKIPPEAAYGDVKRFAVALSSPVPNPDLARNAGGRLGTGKLVLVTFTVRIPTQTPITDDVYIATDVSNWNPVAIKMDRVDALHYRVTQQFASGTKLLYRYTRGSWLSEERSQGGMEEDPHQFVVGDQDVIRRQDVVYHWADENAANPGAGAGAVPTPFNPRPFPTPH